MPLLPEANFRALTYSFCFHSHPIPDYSVDLPNLYKRSIVFFRSLHSHVRLLPAYNLYRRLRKYGNISQLRLGYRMVSVDTEQSGEIGIGKLGQSQ